MKASELRAKDAAELGNELESLLKAANEISEKLGFHSERAKLTIAG